MSETSRREALQTGLADRALLGQLWPLLSGQGRWLAVAVVSTILTALLALLRPLVMLRAIDAAIATRSPAAIVEGGVLYAGVALLEQLLLFAQTYSTQIVGARSMATLRESVFRRLGELPLRFFDNQPVGRLVTRVTNDVDAILELFNSGALGAVGDLLRLGGVVVLMLVLDWKLALVAFAALPVVALLVVWVRRRARDLFRLIRAETARMNATMNEQVTGSALVRAYGRESAMFRDFDEINASYRDANVHSIKYEAIQDAAIDALSAVSLASMVVALGYHHASFGTVVAFWAYLGMFFEPISMLAQRYTLLQSALSGAERVFSLLAVEERDAPELPASAAAAPGWPHPQTGVPAAALELEAVTFGYKPGHDVLRDVSLVAQPGETVALVGPTGSGKTTITALLLRLYECEHGAVRVFGRDVRSMPRHELRRQFAVVPQDVFLFTGTLAENVAAGEEPDRERVAAVFERMGVTDVFASRPGGLDAEVRAGGANFSGGERQLIAFARALYRDAPILVLDEATASVDRETEARIQRALTELLRGRTALVVAHRLATIRAADAIVVLQKGRVVERGSHDELVAEGGLYAALHRLQFSREPGRERAAAALPG